LFNKKNSLLKKAYFMQNNLLRSLFSKQLIHAKQLIRISFDKTTYSKQLIYAKTAYQDLFFQNNLFKTAYLCKTAY